ncbi:MAG: hypothetical protein WA999_07955 [Spirulinaceae cyanobacterium]
MANAQRLDQVEDDLETVKLLLTSTARIVEGNNQYPNSSTDRIDRNAQQIDRNSQQIDNLIASQQTSQERLDSFIFHSQRLISNTAERVGYIEGNTEILQEFSQNLTRNYETQRQEFQDWKITVNTSVERIDRILDYLIRSLPRDED